MLDPDGRRVLDGVDRLEARGWATRLSNLADKRSSLISLTASGAALVAEAERTFHEHLDELLSPAISADQIDAAGATLAALRRALELARVGVPSAVPGNGRRWIVRQSWRNGA